MRVKRDDVTREEVIRFYATYDCGKKKRAPPPDMDTWPWHDPDGLDRKLDGSGLKDGVLAAYRTWRLTEFGVVDILESAIVNSVFPGQPQAIGQLILRGKLAEWLPNGSPEWWWLIGNGFDLGIESALIARPALESEAPARWYVEDGSGRALALIQRILRYGEASRTAWVYLGHEPDERSAFIKSHPKLK